MSLMLRRRMLLAQQDDGNLADVVINQHNNTKVTKIDNGFLIEVLSYVGAYGNYARFDLTTLEITDSLWGKKVRCSANISYTNSEANPLYRLGYVAGVNNSWKDFKTIGTLTDGMMVLETILPSKRPNDMAENSCLSLLINTQRNNATPLNIMTITNIRLEVID